MVASGIHLKSHIFLNQLFQDRFQNILVFLIRIETVLVRTVTDNVIQMPVSIHFIKSRKIFRNGFEIFPVSLFFLPALEKFRVLGICAVNQMGGTDYEIKRIFPQKIVKIFAKMKLQADLNSKTDADLILISFL